MVNLTGNAIKFTHKGGVYVTASRPIDNPAADQIVFKVRDTGVGISGVEFDKLF